MRNTIASVTLLVVVLGSTTPPANGDPQGDRRPFLSAPPGVDKADECFLQDDKKFTSLKQCLACVYYNVTRLPIWEKRQVNQKKWHLLASGESKKLVDKIVVTSEVKSPEDQYFNHAMVSINGIDEDSKGSPKTELCSIAEVSLEKGCRYYYCKDEEAYNLPATIPMRTAEKKLKTRCGGDFVCKPSSNCHGAYEKLRIVSKWYFNTSMVAWKTATVSPSARKSLAQLGIKVGAFEKFIDNSIEKGTLKSEELDGKFVRLVQGELAFAVGKVYTEAHSHRAKLVVKYDPSTQRMAEGLLREWQLMVRNPPREAAAESYLKYFKDLDRARLAADYAMKLHPAMEDSFRAPLKKLK